ncbi:MAG TPA: hypothetical protein VJ420_03210 [Candidatus Udaeobacter sp.]|nr:hypothetical protein [Candidatus Udaeobacter sp.]
MGRVFESPRARNLSYVGKTADSDYRDAVIRVYDESGSVIETQEHTGEFKEW